MERGKHCPLGPSPREPLLYLNVVYFCPDFHYQELSLLWLFAVLEEIISKDVFLWIPLQELRLLQCGFPQGLLG